MTSPAPVGAGHHWQLAISPDAPACGALVCFSLEVPPAQLGTLGGLLSAAEQARAARFQVPGLAARFTVAHARLRQLLAPLLDIEPAQIEFAAGAHGKPRLAGRAAHAGIHFNLSHSGPLGMVGWARSREIGVDIEAWRPMRDEAALVRRFFSPAEIAAYEALPSAQRSEGFFNAWTRKEAYVKAVGRGLTLPLDSFDVTLDCGAGARLLRPSAQAGDGRGWSLAAPQGPPQASLAVVLECGQLTIRAG